MRKTFTASLENLYPMIAFIRECLFASGFDPQIIAKVELASEEALVNIIHYAYPESQTVLKPIDIECVDAGRPGIQISISDRGIPFDPLQSQSNSSPTAPVEEQSIGGYGIPLILKIMDQTIYRREDNANVLTLIKYL